MQSRTVLFAAMFVTFMTFLFDQAAYPAERQVRLLVPGCV